MKNIFETHPVKRMNAHHHNHRSGSMSNFYHWASAPIVNGISAKNQLRFSVICLALLFMGVDAHAQGNYFTLGDASPLGNDCFRLTPDQTNQNGAVWNDQQLNMNNSFEISFTANFGSKDIDGADGIAFVLHSDVDGIAATGGFGGALGYADAFGSPIVSPSVAVEFDTYYNGNDPGGNFRGDPGHLNDHIAIVENANQNAPLNTIVNASATSTNIEDGQFHDIDISWNAATHILSVYFDGAFRTSAHIPNMITTLGSSFAFWGFTSGTGSWSNHQRVCVTSVCTRPEFQVAIGEDFPHAPGLEEEGLSVKPTADCGYITVGRSLQPSGLNHMFATKTFEDGTVEWTRRYVPINGLGEGVLQNVEVLDDGYAVTGWVDFFGQRDIIVMRLDLNGQVIWDRRIGNIDDEEIGYDIEQTPNGHLTVLGSSPDEVILANFTPLGGTNWIRNYGYWNQQIQGFSMEPTDDNGDGRADDGFVIVGTNRQVGNPSTGDTDWMIFKTDATGNAVWYEVYQGGHGDDVALSVKQIDINEFIIGGYVTDISGVPRRDAAIAFFPFAPPGATFETMLYSQGTNSEIHGIEQTEEGGFILTGFDDETAFTTSRDAFLINTDASGNILWNQVYGTTGRDDWALSVDAIDNGAGYVFTGGTYSFQANQDKYLVKTDLAGNSPCNTGQGNFVKTEVNISHSSHTIQLETPPLVFILGIQKEMPVITEMACSAGKREMTGIPSVGKSAALSSYPNPIKSGDVLVLEWDASAFEGNKILKVIDVTGKVMVNSVLNTDYPQESLKLPTQGWAKGIYQIVLQSENELLTQKVVVK